jgi:hypothetical protein
MKDAAWLEINMLEILSINSLQHGKASNKMAEVYIENSPR